MSGGGKFRARFERLRRQLHALAPVLFPKRRGARPPLARGIHRDIAARLGWSAKDAHWFLRTWCDRPRYRQAIAAGGPRLNLDGVPDGEVLPAEQAAAVAALAAPRGHRSPPRPSEPRAP